MRSVKVFRNGTQNLPGTISTHRLSFGGPWDNMGAEDQARTLWPTAGTISKVRVERSAAVGSGNTSTFRLRKAPALTTGTPSFSDTAITFTITGTSQVIGEDLVNTATVAAGDLLYLQMVNTGSAWAADANVTISFDFESTNTGESGYTSRPLFLATTNGNVRIGNPFIKVAQSSALDTWMNAASFSVDTAETEMPIAGTLTQLFLHIDRVPSGSGNGWQVCFYKNGVKQDGSGGTVDTRVSCTNTTITSNATFSLALAVGDRVYAEITTLNSPQAAMGHIAATFVAAVDGESLMGSVCTDSPTSTQYFALTDQVVMSGTEAAAMQTRGATTSFYMSRLRVRLENPPTGSDSRTTTIRKNSGATSQSVTITGASDSGADLTDSVLIDDGDSFGMQFTTTVGSVSSRLNWLVVQTPFYSLIEGSFVAGVDGTISATHSAFFNLDGVTRIFHAQGSFGIGGNLALIEQASAPAAMANVGRLYVEDNGSGKTRLMVQFGSGAAQQIAIEP